MDQQFDTEVSGNYQCDDSDTLIGRVIAYGPDDAVVRAYKPISSDSCRHVDGIHKYLAQTTAHMTIAQCITVFSLTTGSKFYESKKMYHCMCPELPWGISVKTLFDDITDFNVVQQQLDRCTSGTCYTIQVVHGCVEETHVLESKIKQAHV